MGAQNIQQINFLAIFSCKFYVKTKWNSLLIFQILFFRRHRFAAFKNALEVPFSVFLLKLKGLRWTSGSLNHPHEHGFTDKYLDTRVFQIALRSGRKYHLVGGRIKNFVEGNFVVGCWEPEVGWFWIFEPSPKLNTTFSKYWTSFKIKISMT